MEITGLLVCMPEDHFWWWCRNMGVQYAGGTTVNNTFTGNLKSDILTNVMSSLLTAGWSTVIGITPSTVTFTTGTPGVVNLAAHGLPANTRVVFTSTGTLPTGITGNTTVYYVTAPTTNSFNLATSSGGAAIALSGTPTGTATMNCELLMQTATTPQTYAIRARIRDNGGVSIQFTIESVDGTKVGTNNNGTGGGSIFPTLDRVFRIIANKYQFTILVPGDVNVAREWVMICCPYVFSFMPTLANIGFMCSNSVSDTNTGYNPNNNWRLQLDNNAVNFNNMNLLYDTNFWEEVGGPGIGGAYYGPMLVYPTYPGNGGVLLRRYGNGDSLTADPLVAWGLTSPTDEAQVRCQLWDAIIIMDQFLHDMTTSFDSHNWYNLTASQYIGSNKSLFLVIP